MLQGQHVWVTKIGPTKVKCIRCDEKKLFYSTKKKNIYREYNWKIDARLL